MAVVVPAFGKESLTRLVVEDLVRERDLARVVVVDNAGDLDPARFPTDVELVVPGSNLGWLRGTNLGMERALSSGAASVMGLNNDTRLSRSFVRGMADALAAHPLALVGPCYDDSFEHQNRYYRGHPVDFQPRSVEVSAPAIDGTCFALSSAQVRQTGLLDARRFGRRGWGAIQDYAIRVRQAGGQVLVTRRAYLAHDRGSTARASMSSYERYAASEMRIGMMRKYGRRWRNVVDTDASETDSARRVLGDMTRAVEDRLGLSETWVGRR
ncbi:GT2 family glycosyltransferase [Pseudokineococcus lusitanus]|uniref:GT2 family glycosyltransferase n=2 Tax=Pseudokineococcus lusitanus TaxID=763993 RepID=A0A3N1G958_9ACTN|nr:GT2 family glycosyltransferase [Pseudokineococcus lusitanus]